MTPEILSLKDLLANSKRTLDLANQLEEDILQILLKKEGNSIRKVMEKYSNLEEESKEPFIDSVSSNKNILSSHLIEIKNFIKAEIEIIKKEIRILNSRKKNKKSIPFKYATTGESAEYLSVDTSFLTKRKSNQTFIENVHYSIPTGETILRWHPDELDKWMTGNNTHLTKEQDAEIEKLLKRR